MKEYQYIAPLYDILLYPFVKRIRCDVLKIVLDMRPQNVLDVACGTGDQLRLLQENGIAAVGVDMSEAMLRVCRRSNPASDCLLQDGTAMAFQDQCFELVMVSFALHEAGWETAQSILLEIQRVLKPAGCLLLVDYTDFQKTPFYVRHTIRLIEFMAGRRHFRNFCRYHQKGGLKSLIDQDRFHSLASYPHASQSISIQLFKVV